MHHEKGRPVAEGIQRNEWDSIEPSSSVRQQGTMYSKTHQTRQRPSDNSPVEGELLRPQSRQIVSDFAEDLRSRKRPNITSYPHGAGEHYPTRDSYTSAPTKKTSWGERKYSSGVSRFFENSGGNGEYSMYDERMGTKRAGRDRERLQEQRVSTNYSEPIQTHAAALQQFRNLPYGENGYRFTRECHAPPHGNNWQERSHPHSVRMTSYSAQNEQNQVKGESERPFFPNRVLGNPQGRQHELHPSTFLPARIDKDGAHKFALPLPVVNSSEMSSITNQQHALAFQQMGARGDTKSVQQPRPHLETQVLHRQVGTVSTESSARKATKTRKRKKIEVPVTQRALEEHMQTLRNAFKEHKLTCQVCGKVLSTQASKKRHERNHFTRPEKPCTICGSVFRNKRNLNRHMRNEHPGVSAT
mmetsp:Transcript_12895/g.31611  ORF Transcript_12895/g.31611 Transcript_12895/m.31611 type:complete len:415 (+) Transcript_12895:223-1467(+)